MQLGQDVLHDLPTALGSEWLLANGLGGSASGTAPGAAIRRTHSLLTAATGHGTLTTLLLGVDARLRVDGALADLACHPTSRESARPAGHELLESFALDPFPLWTWNAHGVRIEQRLFLLTGHNAVVMRWRHLDGPAAHLAVSPLLAARAPDQLQREPEAAPAVHVIPGRMRVDLTAGAPSITLWYSGAMLPARMWRSLPRIAEGEVAEAGFIAGHVEATLAPGGELHLVVSTEADLFRALAAEDRLGQPPPKTLAECVAALERGERAQRAGWVESALLGADLTAHQARTAHASTPEPADVERVPLLDGHDGWTAPLSAALLAGLVRRPHRLGIAAALPHAVERGADALRVIPGLLAIRAFEPGREVLRAMAEYLDEGVAVTWFDPADGTPHYGDPEASLWFLHAAELYARRSADLDFANAVLVPACESIVQFFRGGTRHDIGVDDDGLLAAGGVRRADLNALWFHGLVALAQLAKSGGRKEHGAFYLAWAREHQQRFSERFWDEANGALYDRIEDDGPISGLTPSQVLALGMTPPILPAERAATLLATIERELLTAHGLRVAPGASKVEPRWLGMLAGAQLRAARRSPASNARVHAMFRAVRDTRRRLGGALPEALMLDARPPFDVIGRAGDAMCIVTASELLRAWIEDVEHAAAAVSAAR